MKLKKDEFNKKMNDGWVLTNKQIDYISRYPLFYNAWAGSVLELFCFQRFWIWLAKFVPASLAPSTLTLIGLTFNLFGCITVIYYSPDFKSCEIPRFVPLLLALSTFLYQTLDALYGKQAYKVKLRNRRDERSWLRCNLNRIRHTIDCRTSTVRQ